MNLIKIKATMKSVFPVFLLIMTSVFAEAQQNIVGTWEVNLSESLDRMKNETKALYDTLPHQTKQRISKSFSGRLFIFQDEGIVTIQWKTENTVQKVQGTWEYNLSSNLLLITTDSNQVSEFDVTTLTSTVLILKTKDASGIFQELFLVKRS